MNWKIACLIVAALWVAQTVALTLALAFWFLPRAAQLWQWEGYWLGRKDEQDGTPVPPRMLPPRTEPGRSAR